MRPHLLVLLAAACGNPSTEPAPVLRTEPTAAVVPAPAKAPATPATSPTPPTAPTPTTPATPAAPVVQAPLPPPLSPDQDPSRVPLAEEDIELGADVQFDTEPIAEGFHMEAQLPVFEDEAKTAAIASRVRQDVRRVLAGNPNVLPRNYEGSCDLTLVTASLASYMCHYSVTEYGDRESWTETGRVGLTYQISSRWPAPVLTGSWFVAGTDVGTIADVACQKANHHRLHGEAGCAAEDVAFAIQHNGIRVGWPSSNSDFESDLDDSELVLGWNEIGKLVRRDGPLGTLATAVEHAEAETPLSRVAGPPPPGSTALAIGEAGDLKEIARRWWSERGVRVMITDAAAGQARLIRARGIASSSVDRQEVSRTEVPFVLPQLGLGIRRLRRGTTLRSAPRGDAPVVAPLVSGAIVATLEGPIGSDESSVAPGMWTYVVPNASTAGWMPSGLLGTRTDPPPEPGGALPPVNRGPRTFSATLRDPNATVYLDYTPSPDGRTTGISIVGGDAERRDIGPLEGAITDLRLTRTDRRGELLLLVALARSATPETLQWQAYRLGPRQPTTAVLDVPLPTDATLPEAQRTAVRAGIQNRGRFAPFLVRKRGAADVVYTWNGSALQTGGT